MSYHPMMLVRKHGSFDNIPREPLGQHYLGVSDEGWQYYIVDDFGNLVPTGGPFDCL